MQSKGKQKWVKKLGYNVGRGWRGDQKWRSNKHNILINHTKAKVCECKAKVLTNKLRHTIINMNCYVIEQIWRIPEVMQHPKIVCFYHLLLAYESNDHGNWHNASYTPCLDCVGTAWRKLFPFPRKCQVGVFVKGVALLLKVTGHGVAWY